MKLYISEKTFAFLNQGITIVLLGIGIFLLKFRVNTFSKIIMSGICGYTTAHMIAWALPCLYIVLGAAKICSSTSVVLNVFTTISFVLIPIYNIFIISKYGGDDCGCMSIFPSVSPILQILIGMIIFSVSLFYSLRKEILLT